MVAQRTLVTVLEKESSSTMRDTPTESMTTSLVSDRITRRHRRKLKLRGIGSRNVLLVLIWEFIFSCTFTNQLYSVYQYKLVIEGNYIFCLGVLSVLLPIASLLSEVATSRYKLVSYTLRVMWLISIVDCIITVSGEWLQIRESILIAVKLILVLLPQPVLCGAFLASAVPLGMDQIMAGSSSEVSSFIHWLVWAMNGGIGLTFVSDAVLNSCVQMQSSKLNMILHLVPVLLLSVGLILDFFLSHKLVREPVTVNPVALIFKVLKYAAKHKHPVRRSAFTYCENERPSRLDNGKSKYGGPFTTEQVEDVKTFWRILLVIFVMSLLCLSVGPQLGLTEKAFTYYQLNCKEAILNKIKGVFLLSVIYIPLYELLVYPCLRNRGPRILQSVGIGAAAVILSSLYGLTVETVQYYHSSGTVQCLNDTCYFTFIPYTLILGFVTIVLPKTSIEFVCAQAPYNMRSLLIGLHFATLVIFLVCGAFAYETWKKYIVVMDSSRYGIWFYLTTLVLAVVSSLLLGCVVRRYKPRERDEITNIQTIVEDIFIKEHEARDLSC